LALARNSVGIDLLVLVINGINDGPTLLLNSTDHGAEIQGIEVILRLMKEHVDPKKLKGDLRNPSDKSHRIFRSEISILDFASCTPCS
jgi:hypothetical protein